MADAGGSVENAFPTWQRGSQFKYSEHSELRSTVKVVVLCETQVSGAPCSLLAS